MKQTTEVPIYKTNYTANIPKELVDAAQVKNPDVEIMVHFDALFDLDFLENDESCIWGDGETFVFILKIKK